MRKGPVFLSLMAFGLAGCGGSATPDGVRTDQDYANAMDVGREAFDMTRASQARAQFAAAYDRALLRDDAGAIHDAGYNLGVADLGMDDAHASLATVARVTGDLALRGEKPGPGLSLVAMAAFYRLGDYRQALETGRQVVTDDPALEERRLFLTGLAADGLDDGAALAAALSAFPHSARQPLLEQADRAELTARLAMRQGQPDKAEQEALKAVAARRDMLDYRGMARGLDCAARAARGAGQAGRAAAYAKRAVQSRAQGGRKP